MDTEHDMTDLQNGAAAVREKKPTALKALVFLLVIGLLGVALAAFVLTQRSETGPLVADKAPTPISVRTVSAEMSEELVLEEAFTGLATPRRTSMLGFQSGGRIDRITVDTGSRVGAGQTLAQLDTRSLQAQLSASEAVVNEARAGRDLAATTVKRQKLLLEKGHVAQQRVDEAQAQVDTATARINAAMAQADTLRVQIDLMKLKAPFAGVITGRMADEGAIAAPGIPILELVEIGRMEARIGLPAKEASELNKGEVYTLVSDQGPVKAKLRAVTGVINSGQRTVETVFDIAEPGKVAAGAVVRLSIDRAVDERGLWVPLGALTEGNRGLWALYAAEPEDGGHFARKRPVEIVHTEADRAYVRGAVSEGDRIIIEGIQRLTTGMPVMPVAAELATTGGEG